MFVGFLFMSYRQNQLAQKELSKLLEQIDPHLLISLDTTKKKTGSDTVKARHAVWAFLRDNGASFSQIGNSFFVTRQAVHKALKQYANLSQ